MAGVGRIDTRISALLFADVKGYSEMRDPQLRQFFDRTLTAMAQVLHNHSPFFCNSWGDAVVAAFDDALVASNCALDLRDLFNNTDWDELQLPRLALRVSLHCGHLYLGHDPITDKQGLVGTQVNLAARVEPVTLPGHVWMTDNFVSMLQQHSPSHLAWDDLGERPLAKNWGTKRLFWLRRAHETAVLPSVTSFGPSWTAKSQDELTLCLTMLEMGNENQRITALSAMKQFHHPDAIKALLSSFKNKSNSHEARRTALASMAVIKSPRVVPDLLEVLRDPDELPEFVRCSAEVLGDIRDARAIPGLVALAEAEEKGSVNGHIRGTALVALACLKDERSESCIARALKSDTETILESAVIAAGATESSKMCAALARIAVNKSEWPEYLRDLAVGALLRIGPSAAQQKEIEGIALDSQEALPLRRQAMRFLGRVETESARLTLMGIAKRLDDPASSDALQALLEKDESTRTTRTRDPFLGKPWT